MRFWMFLLFVLFLNNISFALGVTKQEKIKVILVGFEPIPVGTAFEEGFSQRLEVTKFLEELKVSVHIKREGEKRLVTFLDGNSEHSIYKLDFDSPILDVKVYDDSIGIALDSPKYREYAKFIIVRNAQHLSPKQDVLVDHISKRLEQKAYAGKPPLFTLYLTDNLLFDRLPFSIKKQLGHYIKKPNNSPGVMRRKIYDYREEIE